jgi:hypothetical protein
MVLMMIKLPTGLMASIQEVTEENVLARKNGRKPSFSD